MSFPLSISGRLELEVPPQRTDLRARLRDALIAEAVENVVEGQEDISFRAIMRIRVGVSRPGGARWLFAIFDRGQFVIRQEKTTSICYRLGTRYAFWQIFGIAFLSLIFLLLFAGEAGKVAGLVFSGFWCLAFISEYQRASKGIRHWLHLVATAPVMPPPKPLEYDDP